MKKSLILLSLFVGFYMLGHFALRSWNQRKASVSEATKLVNCDPGKIQSVRIIQPSAVASEATKELVFERIDSPDPSLPALAQFAKADWRLISPRKIEADSSILNRLTSLVCEQYNPLILKPDSFALSESKDSRALKISYRFFGQEKDSGEIHFGLVTADRMNIVQLKTGSESTVAKVPLSLLEASSMPEVSFENRRVLKMSADNIQTATVFKDGKESFTVQRAGADWKVLQAGKEIGEGSAEAGKYVNRLSTLRGIDILDAEFAPEKCEKEKTNYRVEFVGVANRKETLFLNAAKGKPISSCSSERTAKFKIHEDILKYISQPKEKLISRKIN